MAIESYSSNIKLQLKLEEGTQTIPDCFLIADYERLYTLGQTVAKLIESPLKEIVCIEETELIDK